MKTTIQNVKKLLLLGLLLAFNFNLLAGDYGDWKPFGSLPQLDYRVRRVEYNTDAKKYEWHVLFRNRYGKTIHFDFCLNETGVTTGGSLERTSLRSGSEGKSAVSPGGGWFLLKTDSRPEVCIRNVRFGDDDSGPYATHD
jgi:hypothetical protein